VTGTSVVLAFLFAVGTAAPAFAQRQAVSWKEIRPRILDGFCAGETKHEGTTYRWANFGETGCPGIPKKTPVQRAIADAFEDARSVLVSVKTDASESAEKVPDPEKRRAAYADALLADPLFLRALMVSMEPALARAGLSCADCPETPPAVSVTVGWLQFREYVAAHVWPAPVQTPAGSAGKPATRPRYSFHVCAGLNGIARLPDPDPRLVRAAFVAGFDSELGELARPLFQRILKEPALRSSRSDDEKTEYLRRRLGEEVKRSAVVRKAVCRAVEARRPVLGVKLDPC
jgi:hypothetical protein